MTWTRLRHSRNGVNVAAQALVEYELLQNFDMEVWQKYSNALPVINNWRASHSFPLNTFKIGLNRNADRIDGGSLTAQRIKRLSSISQKLQRFPNMKLSQMQDIGGCRAVMRSVDKVRELETVYKKSEVKHKLDHVDDYIMHPKASGYRGVHIIWRYHSDRQEYYNGFKIEMQLRSALQHSWATAVETVGTFLQQGTQIEPGRRGLAAIFRSHGYRGGLQRRYAACGGHSN